MILGNEVFTVQEAGFGIKTGAIAISSCSNVLIPCILTLNFCPQNVTLKVLPGETFDFTYMPSIQFTG